MSASSLILKALLRLAVARSWRVSSFAPFVLALLIVGAPAAQAITINMEYTDEGDPVPHDENPTWDPDGTILKAHFNAAKAIWESLLPGEGEISFDFHWDDNIDGLGLYTPGIDEFIEINPDRNWYVDPTPNDNSEFDLANAQTLHGDLSAFNQTFFFPGTVPPGALEVGFRGTGISGTSSVTGFDASNGFDLLSTVLHEIGHALGINGIEPGDYNILPEHLGGLTDVTVKEGDGGHLAGQGSVPFLMCENCASIGVRRFATATDILILAEELGVSDVHLARVGRISSGDWTTSNAWIGADVPTATQDVYVTQGGAVLLDIDANVKSLRIRNGSTVDAQTLNLVAAGDIDFDGGSLAVGIGGSITAGKINGDPASLTTTAASIVRFNDFTRGSSAATAATFQGDVEIGVASGTEAVTFNPDVITDWNVGQNLRVGGGRPVTLVIDNGAWTVGGNLDIGGEVVVEGGTLAVTGAVNITGPGGLTYKTQGASNTTYNIGGGGTYVVTMPPPVRLEHTPAGRMVFENTSANSATINVDGGTGDGGINGYVTFSGFASAGDAHFHTKTGVGGVSLRISNPVVIAGTGGRVVFADSSQAGSADFRNDGVNHHGPHGSGGATYFFDDASANVAEFDNYGAPMTNYAGSVPAPGGRTEFFGESRAASATFRNHPGQGMGALGAGITIFHGSSRADNATFYNKGAVPGLIYGGSTEFYDNSNAGDAVFYNEHSPSLSQHAGTAGNVRFYNNSSAGTAAFFNQAGGGTVFFNDTSTAADADFFIEDTGTGTFTGHVVFLGSSKGGTADFIIRENCFSASIEFRGTSNAEQAQITLVNGSQAGVMVTNGASLGQANLDLGNGSGLQVREFSTAANSTIRLRPGASATVTGAFNAPQLPTATLGDATVNIDGGSVSGGGGGALFMSQWGTAGNATINIHGGTVPGAGGGQIHFGGGAHAGTATVNALSGVAGAGGGGINLGGGTIANNARFTVGAGGFLSLPSGGPIEVGSIEGTGTIQLGHNELRTGALNMSTTISGPIIGFATNPRLTKIGTGTLTLSGANTYIGLTKVDGGTLMINGSNSGPAEVNSGATLGGIGTIGGTVTVNSGGIFAPGNSGTSPNPITVGGLAMATGSVLDFELGPTTYDRILTSGNLALAGTLSVALVDGFMPTTGSMFDLFNWGTQSGAFSTLNLPALAGGLNWDTSQLYTTGVLSVAAGLAGDFSGDGVVDAADYVMWRKTNGTVDLYNTWRGNFGNARGAGSENAAVPEPSVLILIVAIASTSVVVRHRSTAVQAVS